VAVVAQVEHHALQQRKAAQDDIDAAQQFINADDAVAIAITAANVRR